ncbi:SDR family oxidoreductase [Gordonia sp. (in: high G+C Gram-positive bacteria)]|uniref:SDR family oxidoreductase n=1 Tax=Gordonia sp. (in: high G+C Gram-positive bacteria) TaxID=84139 RepID=UPI002FD982DE
MIPGVTGRHVLVTGAAGGIGGAVVVALESVGAQVSAWDQAGVDGVRAVDVRDQDAVREAWRATEAAGGTIELLVHAAGVMSDDWDVCMAVNAGGVRNTLDVATSAMIDRGTAGSIVVLSSNAAAIPRTAMAEYAASKAAATSYTRSVGLAVAGHGIRVNVVSPGSTLTPMLTGMWTSDTDRERVLTGTPEQFRLGIPLGRIADPADIASTAVFLLSDAARHITMHDLRVDGGATLDM